jgi:hypothetical protein
VNQTTCRACSAPIFFALTVNSRRIPIDVEPCEDGNVVVVGDMAVILTKEMMAAGVQGKRYRAHWASCPKSKQFRKPATIPEGETQE